MGYFDDWPPRHPGLTWGDLGKPSSQRCWQYIRAIRATPPGFARNGPRSKVLKAALNQSEQLFSAALQVDFSARPLLAYYGLAQACSAIIQASPRVPNSSASPNSHGMTWEIQGRDLVVNQSASNGLLARTMEATNSGGIGTGVNISRLWSLLPESGMGLVRGTLPELAPWHVNPPRDGREATISVPVRSLRKSDFAQTLTNLTSERPIIGEFDLKSPSSTTRWTSDNEPDGFVLYGHTDTNTFDQALKNASVYYDTRSISIFAALDNGGKPVHPIVAWLAMLFALSMVARYRADHWVAMLDVDSRTDAAMYEEILLRASIVCPGLILNTVDHMDALYNDGIRP
jgi:hypothetical protein